MTRYALVADLGGTLMRVAIVDEDGRIAQRRVTHTLAHQGRDDVVNRLVSTLTLMAGTVRRKDIVGVGISIAGPTDPKTGTVYDSPNLPGWDGFSAKSILEQSLSLKSSILNDANLAALAEYTYGAGKGYTHMVYLTISTGIGGGIIIDGDLYNGAQGFGGELGHMTIDRDGPECNCGNTGCLEALASGTAIATIARERLSLGAISSLRELSGADPIRIDARMVAKAAMLGDALSHEIIQEAATNLGIGIVNLLHIFDPDIIVIGGGLSQSLQLFMPGIRNQIEQRSMKHTKGSVRLMKSRLGDDANLLGASALAFQTHARVVG